MLWLMRLDDKVSGALVGWGLQSSVEAAAADVDTWLVALLQANQLSAQYSMIKLRSQHFIRDHISRVTNFPARCFNLAACPCVFLLLPCSSDAKHAGSVALEPHEFASVKLRPRKLNSLDTLFCQPL
jgi:hypothetical protein